jgi:hypothetical protein
VSDIFQEVDEEVRRDQLKKLWERHQNLIVSGVVLILLAVAGWRGYEYWQAKQAIEAGTAFETAAILAAQGKHEEADAAFAKVATEGTPTYRQLARVRRAAELAHTDAKAAVAMYETIAADSSVGRELQDLAGMRAGVLLMDSGSYGEARARLEPLSADQRPYRHTAREFLALAAWRAGDIPTVRRWYDLIVTDLMTPPATRNRVEMLMALVDPEKKGSEGQR